MSEKSSSSGSDEDVEPESVQPVEFGGVLSKVRMINVLKTQNLLHDDGTVMVH